MRVFAFQLVYYNKKIPFTFKNNWKYDLEHTDTRRYIRVLYDKEIWRISVRLSDNLKLHSTK